MKHVCRSKLKNLLPSWCAWSVHEFANTLDPVFDKFHSQRAVDYAHALDFWLEIEGNGKIRIAEPDGGAIDHSGMVIINGQTNPLGAPAQVMFPLNDMMRAAPDPQGEHTLYFHVLGADVPLSYFGVTKNRWWSRFAQHVSSAKSGSPYVFHRALLQHRDRPMSHRVALTGIDYEYAMQMEEEFVTRTLYPAGLNMIPGGHAGLRYLHKLGVTATTFRQRDEAVERLARQPSVKGVPNPLCAARWQADQEYVNRVICGHGDRLTVEQVRQVKLLSGFGLGTDEIVTRTRAKNLRQVENLLRGRHYSRVV